MGVCCRYSDAVAISAVLFRLTYVAKRRHMVSATARPTGDELGFVRVALLCLSALGIDPGYPTEDLEVDFDDVGLDASPAPAPMPALQPMSVASLALILASLGSAHSRRRIS
jgi:hypothetical protein